VHREEGAGQEALWISFANAIIIVGRLIREAWTGYRWDKLTFLSPMTELAQALKSKFAELLRNGATGRMTPLDMTLPKTVVSQRGVTRVTS
jgi:hypothetical protein